MNYCLGFLSNCDGCQLCNDSGIPQDSREDFMGDLLKIYELECEEKPPDSLAQEEIPGRTINEMLSSEYVFQDEYELMKNIPANVLPKNISPIKNCPPQKSNESISPIIDKKKKKNAEEMKLFAIELYPAALMVDDFNFCKPT